MIFAGRGIIRPVQNGARWCEPGDPVGLPRLGRQISWYAIFVATCWMP
jgi:hypothetical protein